MSQTPSLFPSVSFEDAVIEIAALPEQAFQMFKAAIRSPRAFDDDADRVSDLARDLSVPEYEAFMLLQATSILYGRVQALPDGASTSEAVGQFIDEFDEDVDPDVKTILTERLIELTSANENVELNKKIIEKDNERVACVGVDFCLREEKDAGRPYSTYRWGRGKAYKDAIDNLVARTKAARRKFKNMAVIWVVHFPAIASTPSRYRLNDAHKLIRAASRQKIPLILSGHLHESIAATAGSNICVLCAGSMTAIGDESWMHFVNITVDKGSIKACSKIDFIFNPTRRNFVRDKTYSIIA
jgi:hypothetical protein